MEVDSSSEDDWVPCRERTDKRPQVNIIDQSQPSKVKPAKVKWNFGKMKQREKRDKRRAPPPMQIDSDSSSEAEGDKEPDPMEEHYAQVIDEESLKTLKHQIKRETKMFDPCEDEVSEEWFKNKFLSKTNASDNPHMQQLTLSWPGCFTDICYECEPHTSYKNQYRAYTVYNCNVNQDKVLNMNEGSSDLDIHEFWFEVTWDVCGNQVGVYDFEQKAYHLFF